MKQLKRIIPILTIVSLTGCGTLEKKLLTHSPTVEAVTNADNSVSFTTNEVFTVAPKVTETLSTAQSVTPLIPSPWGTLISSLLGLTSLGLGMFAKAKTNQVREKQNAVTVATSLLNTVIAGVEVSNSKEAKRSIANISAATGNGDTLDKVVQSVSAAIPK